MPLKHSNVIAFRPLPFVAEPVLLPARSRAPLRVLIVDDTPEDRMVIRFALEPQGYMLTEAQNGKTGLAAARLLQPDCIVLDYRLPDFDGLEFLDQLRTPSGQIPYAVVMLTGATNGNTATKLLKAGALDYLSKEDLSEASLRRAVNGAVEHFNFNVERLRLRERNAQLAAVVRASDDAIISVGLDLVVRTWNPGANRLFGYSEAEAAGRHIDELITPASGGDTHSTHYEDIVTRHQSVVGEAVRRHKDGTLIDVEINASPILDGPELAAGISLILRDIRERKRAEQERFRMQDRLDIAETERRHSDARLEMAWSASAGGAWHWDLTTGMAIVSSSYRDLFGFEPDETITFQRWITNVHPDDRPRIEAYTTDYVAADPGGDYAIEFRAVSAKHGVRWIAGRARAERDATGRAVRIYGINLDITERRGAEEQVRLNEARLRQILDGVHAFVGLLDPSGIVLDLNAAAIAASGTDRASVIGRRFEAMPCWHAEVRAELRTILEAAAAGQPDRRDLPWLAPDGELRWVDFQIAPVLDASGQVVAIVPSGTDITDRRRMEETLRHSESRFRSLFENVPTGIAITDLHGNFDQCNPAFCALLGYTDAEFRQMDFADLLHPDDRANNAVLTRQLQSGEVTSFKTESRYIRKGGSTVWVHKFVSTLPDEASKPARLFAIVTDVTEDKVREDHIRLLMAEVNHRAKNMLGVVQAIARQVAASSTMDNFEVRFSERVQALAKSLDALVRDNWNGIGMDELVHTQLAHLNLGTRISVGGPPLRVSSAAAQILGMAMHELGTNACKYGAMSNSDGHVHIAWTVRADAQQPPRFTLSWQESGGPPVAAPQNRGFGTTVFHRMVRSGLNATVTLDFAPAGLTWHIDCPIAAVLEASATAPKQA